MEPDKPQGTETEIPIEASRFEQGMMERLAEALKEGHLKSAIQCVRDNHLIPIWYTPFMFCGKPGDPRALPNPQEMGPCLRKSARVIAWMVVEGILPARDPDTWMPLAFEPVTPDWLVKWSDLEEAAIEHMGLRTGYIEALEGGIAEVSLDDQNASELSPNAKRNYHRLIRALAALANLDLTHHYKAAEVLMSKASEQGLPYPQKVDTWAGILKRANSTD